ncbi:MAG: response regulator [Gammaproteobacteria bacterium]|nr:response regulator [Gammaproteobacteria bacterium]
MPQDNEKSGKQRPPPGADTAPGSLAAEAGTAGLLANISHELRIPMDAVLGYVDLVRQTDLDDHQQTLMTQIERAARGLLDIIDDIHNLSRMEAGKLEIHQQPFSIRDCVESVTQMLAPSAYRRGLDFIRVIDSDVPVNFLGDPLRIRQILINLIGNAIKFTEHGQIRLKISASPLDNRRHEVLFEVIDSGIGIADEDLPDLFKPFSRPAKPQEDISGTGLGLVICQSLCHQMGGSIAVHSTPGVGSTFCARIPLEMLAEAFEDDDSGVLLGRNIVISCADRDQASCLSELLRRDGAITRSVNGPSQLEKELSTKQTREDALLAVISAGDMKDEKKLERDWRAVRGQIPVLALASSSAGNRLKKISGLIGGQALPAHTPAESIIRTLAMLIQGSSGKSPPAVAGLTPGLLAGLRLLVADDNQFSREYLQMLLQLHGASVDICPDGLVACEMIAERTYDLVLMDVRMPHCDGVAAMQKLTQSGLPFPPVIGLTAAPEECCRALNSGMTDCLLKPIRPSVLLQYIKQHQGMEKGGVAAQAHEYVDQEMRAELNIELPRRADELAQAIRNGEMNTALEAAHKISGAAAICGFRELHATAASIEGLIRQRQLDGIEQLTRTLGLQIDKALASLLDL